MRGNSFLFFFLECEGNSGDLVVFRYVPVSTNNKWYSFIYGKGKSNLADQ